MKSLLILGGFLTLFVSTSTFFFIAIEGWSALDALYFSVVTLTTIGYGDHTPQTALGKLFTTVYAIVAITTFLVFVNALYHHFFNHRPHKN